MIKILNSEFGSRALLLNGIIMGVKGFLSFLSAPLIGALSDVYGRKLFLLVTAFFTCVPIPFIKVRCSLSWKQYLDEQLFFLRTQRRQPPCRAQSTFFPSDSRDRVFRPHGCERHLLHHLQVQLNNFEQYLTNNSTN